MFKKNFLLIAIHVSFDHSRYLFLLFIVHDFNTPKPILYVYESNNQLTNNFMQYFYSRLVKTLKDLYILILCRNFDHLESKICYQTLYSFRIQTYIMASYTVLLGYVQVWAVSKI